MKCFKRDHLMSVWVYHPLDLSRCSEREIALGSVIRDQADYMNPPQV